MGLWDRGAFHFAGGICTGINYRFISLECLLQCGSQAWNKKIITSTLPQCDHPQSRRRKHIETVHQGHMNPYEFDLIRKDLDRQR